MKHSFGLSLLLLLFLTSSCEKTLNNEVPEFSITSANITDDTDETGNPVKKVIFTLSGNAEVVSFYSGETLHDYNFKDGRVVKTKALEMSFSSNCKLNSGTIAPPNQLTILVSTNFSGKYVEADIRAAEWKDITSRFTISPLVATDDFLASGVLNLAELAEKNKPIYVAYKYITPPQTTAQRHTQWRIRDFLVQRTNDLGKTVIASQASSSWTMFHTGPLESGRSSTSSTQIVLRGNNSSANFSQPTEDWAISRPLEVGEEVDLGPDRPIAIKSRGDAPLQTFSYKYASSGNYNVVFTASNVNIKEEKKVVKDLKISIE